MSDINGKAEEGPYHLVNAVSGKHVGPFTTGLDAVMASQIAPWGERWEAMNKAEFDRHLEESFR